MCSTLALRILKIGMYDINCHDEKLPDFATCLDAIFELLSAHHEKYRASYPLCLLPYQVLLLTDSFLPFGTLR